MIYLLTPFAAWLVAGCLKFAINSIKAKKLAFALVGYGGMPSNHSAIVASTSSMIALQEGLDHPAFAVAITLAFIVILDATSLRKNIGKQAQQINILTATQTLRERIGHSKLEVAGGIIVGIAVAYSIHIISQL